MPFVSSGQENLYVEIHGPASSTANRLPLQTPLILIMGFGTRETAWNWNKPGLAQHLQTISFDNRGIGLSVDSDFGSGGAPSGPYSMEIMADDVASVLNGLNIERAHIFGISMGGMIAQEFALRHPERTSSLILGCTTCGLKGIPARDPDVLGTLERIFDLNPKEAAEAMAKISVDLRFMQTHRNVVEEYMSLKLDRPTPPEVKRSQMAAILQHDTFDRLSSLKIPTLIITGREDRLILPENSIRLWEQIPDSELVILPRAAHLFMMEQAKATNESVVRFIKSV